MFSFIKRLFAKPVVAKTENEATGIWGEGVAAGYLKKKGYKIVGKRVKLYRDEIDIVAWDVIDKNAKQLVFVEVKTRASDLFGGGIAAVDKRKRHALSRAAIHYLRKKPKTAFRFDVVEVVGSINSKSPPVIRHHENAFPLDRKYYM